VFGAILEVHGRSKSKKLHLAEWWYNINLHTIINMTSFQALYGYESPHLTMGATPSSRVQAVDELLKERQGAMLQLKQQFSKA
jgi:hypothetical protein